MSRGLSYRQRWLLASIAREATRLSKKNRNEPVAWRAIDYGPTSTESDDNYDTARVQWNIEQATRRSLRSLKRRGLVELGRCCFSPVADMSRGGEVPQIFWNYVRRRRRVPGETRIMTGVRLTEAGWALVAEEEAKGKGKGAGEKVL
jgi:hypothetical protein